MMAKNQTSSFPVMPNLKFMGGVTFQKGGGVRLSPFISVNTTGPGKSNDSRPVQNL
jgi:hypothetical protein